MNFIFKELKIKKVFISKKYYFFFTSCEIFLKKLALKLLLKI